MSAIRTLLLTGHNNHDWRRTSPFVANLLRETGKFEVEITEDPGSALEDAAQLATYDLLFNEYNGPMWSETASTNFESAVRSGTGLVVFHGASLAFPGWEPYERMCGRSFVRGTSSHAEYREIRIVMRDREHAITKDVRNFTQMDELYHTMPNLHGVPVNVLATGYSEPDEDAGMQGSGNDEPVVMTIAYGEGRVFHYTLGHLWPAEVFPGYTGNTLLSFIGEPFQELLFRGCEWAARGEVTPMGESNEA